MGASEQDEIGCTYETAEETVSADLGDVPGVRSVAQSGERLLAAGAAPAGASPAGASPAGAASTLHRALSEPSLEVWRRTGGEDMAEGSIGELLVAHLAEHTARLTMQDAGLRAHRAEAVHRLRIAARRLRSALTTFRPVLDRQITDPLREELRWLGESLAPARDAQVLRERLTGLLREQPAELVIGSVATRIDDQLSAAYAAGQERAVEVLDSARYLRLLEALDDLIVSPPLTPDADVAATTGAGRLLARDVTRLSRAVRTVRAARDTRGRDLAMHEARKKAKRLRYAAEAAVPALGKPARSLATSAKKLQQALGVHQDAVVARQRLREFGVQAHLAGDNAFTYGRLHALEQARAERAEADFADLWRTFRKKQAPRWLE